MQQTTPQVQNGQDAGDFLYHWYWMGPGAVPLVVFSAIFVGLALTTQTVLELNRFAAQDLSGALITIGLLRDLGPLTIGLAWSARAAAFISQEREELLATDFVSFVVPRYFAALLAAIPLCAFGLVAGFLTGALYAPVLGASSTADFMEVARQNITMKDIITFFFKMIVVNPALGVLSGVLCASLRDRSAPHTVAHAITFTFIVGALLNWVVTTSFYLF